MVDNQSTAQSREALSATLAPEELICSARNLGYGGGNNVAIRRAMAARKNYLLLLNSDADISQDGARQLLERLASNPDVSILGPIVREGNDGEYLVGGRDIARFPDTRIIAQADSIKSLPDYPLHHVDYVPGAVFLARAAAFEKIGLFDEQYFFSGETADFCKRAQEGGYNVCVDLEVLARHHVVASGMRETAYVYYNLRNRFLYASKYHPAEKRRYFLRWVGAGALAFAAAVRHGKIKKARAILLALAHGLSGRYGDQNVKFI